MARLAEAMEMKMTSAHVVCFVGYTILAIGYLMMLVMA